jgi:dihydrofolate reductase
MTKRLANVTLIFAVDQNNVIGKNNDIPWKSSHDFRWFRATTLGFNLIMGRKTWESLPIKPLPGRDNIVVSRNPKFEAPGAVVVSSFEEAIAHCDKKQKGSKIYVIGGKALLEEAANVAFNAYISRVATATPVDETCVMAPMLPPHSLLNSYQLFGGNKDEPRIDVDSIVFIE